MRRVVRLYRSTVGKKVLMAVSGVFLVGFIVAHMAGNLKVFQGPEAFNAYAEFIREFGYPLLPHHGLLWIFRVGLLAAVGVHIWAAVSLWSKSREARSVSYHKPKNLSFAYASRTMRWGGVILFFFIVYHILHFTTGQAHPDFVHGDVYHNFITAFRNPLVLVTYLIAQAALCLHLYHGVWSAFQTLGANHPKYNPLRRPIAAGLAIVVFVGFLVPPVTVAAGLVGDEVPRASMKMIDESDAVVEAITSTAEAGPTDRRVGEER